MAPFQGLCDGLRGGCWRSSCFPPTMTSRMPAPPGNRCEVLIGRSLAACVHPLAAWRSKARSFRVLLLAGYFTAGYVAALATLALMR